MDSKLSSMGYVFDPSRYSPKLGYSRLRMVISGQASQRFFDVKTLQIPTFDGRVMHKTRIDRYEMVPNEVFQVCVGELILESYQGERLHAFSLGGKLTATVEKGERLCDFVSDAPIFLMEEDPESISGVMADEIEDLIAKIEVELTDHENELYYRLSKYEPYTIFLACLVSLKKRAESVPVEIRRERFNKISANIDQAIKTVQENDSWDGNSPSLEDLLLARD
jgi:hypothetical protein